MFPKFILCYKVNISLNFYMKKKATLRLTKFFLYMCRQFGEEMLRYF